MSDVMPEPGTIIALVERDHVVIRGLLGRFDVSSTEEWGAVFRDLVEYLARHEVAEQEVVYALLADGVPRSRSAVDDCVAEQHETELRLLEMGAMAPTAPQFREALGHLRDELEAHIAHEEQVIIPLMRSARAHEDPELAQRYEVARMAAPARPQAPAGGEGTSTGEPSGALATLLERLRGALRSHT
ncbi:MAG: hemerythrin domain-containing protein [Acidimicrobiales bacterium]